LTSYACARFASDDILAAPQCNQGKLRRACQSL